MMRRHGWWHKKQCKSPARTRRRGSEDGGQLAVASHAATLTGPDRRWGTLMRHALALERLARTVGGLARGMALAASACLLVAPARLPGAPAPRRFTARRPAVAIAPVAPRAQVHHRAAQVADKPPAIGTQGQASRAWTPMPKPAMIRLLGASAPGSRGRRGSCHRHIHRLPRVYLFPRFSPKQSAHTTTGRALRARR